MQLHNLLETAARRANLPAAAMVKYTASATEQEIRLGALELTGDRSHIFLYSRETRNIPQDGAGKDYLDFDQNSPDKPASLKLGDLKADLKKVLRENYHEYDAIWETSAPSQGHITQLCEHVYKDLETVILSEINQLIDISPLEHEINEQASFAASRRADFIGRMDYLEMLVEYQKKPNAQPLLLVGASGTGKSALMAEAIKRLEESGSGANILYRFIGATPSSSNPASVRESICQQIYDLYDLERVKMNRLKEIVKIGRQADEQRQQIINEYVMTDRSALERYLRKHITGKPLILYIDALDQFSTIGGETPFGWLPTELPELVHLVTSSTPGSHIEALLEKLSGENVIEVKPLAIEDGETILDAWLSGRNRTLQANQKKALLKGFSGCGLPLYLKMAFEEACQWRSYEAPPDLSKDLPGLIRQFFARLAQEFKPWKKLS